MRFSLFRQKIESRLKQAQSRRSKLRGSRLYLESLEQRRLLAGDSAVSSAHMDVNRDGLVSPLDALLIISDLNLNGARPLSISGGGAAAAGGVQPFSLAAGGAPGVATNPALDVNEDGYISPLDALLVVKQLNDVTAQIAVTMEVTDLNGNPISQILVGQQFEVRTFVQDVRSNPSQAGVAAAYTDVTFDGSLASVLAIYHSNAEDPNPNPPTYNFTSSTSGSFATSGLIDEAGGFNAGFTPLGPGKFLLFTAQMTATSGGVLTFTADPADQSPTHDSLVFNPPTTVPTDAISYGSASLTVTDLPAISASPVQVTEGNAGTTPMTFTLNLSGDNDVPITVHYSTSDGNATSSGASPDYQGIVDQVATFPAHTSSIQITVNVSGDLLNEDNETFSLNLFNASGAMVTTPQVTGTILNDDTAPSVTIGDASVSEGTAISGTTALTFTATLSAPSGKTVTVPYTITPGTATVGTDYAASNGVLTFLPGQTTQPIVVNVVRDALNETNETVNVAISSPTNATLGAVSTATGTIVDDDAPPTISIDDQNVGEPASGTTDMVFTVSLSGPSGLSVTVNYVTNGVTATAGQDFGPTGGFLTFAPGETTKTITVKVNADADSEPDETFNVLLSGPVNATIADGTGVGTINDFFGDKLARIRLVATDLNGNPITSVLGGALFKLNAYVQDLRTPADASSGVFAAYMDVDFNSAEFVGVGPITYGPQFQNVPDGAITPGQLDEIGATATSIPTPNGPGEHLLYSIIVQGIAAGSGSFSPSPADAEGHGLLLYGANAPVPVGQVQYIGTDVIQVSAPSLINVDSPTIVEDNSGQKDLTFTITLSMPVSVPVTVNYATVDGTAAGGSDYQITSNTLQFAPGQQTATVKVPIFGDTLNEANETFKLQLSASNNAIIQTGAGIGTIVNDDVAPTISVGNATGMEGISDAAFQVTLSAPSGQVITVHYTTASQTATDGVDYTHSEGTLTFLPGQTAKTVVVNITQDATYEGAETFLFNLSSPTVATLAVAQGIGTITELPGSYLNGYVYTDLNHNGIREAGELGIAGITITLSGTDFFGRAVTRQVTTDSSGLYQFNALVAGTYVLHEQAPSYVVDGVDTLGSIGGSIPANDTFVVTINSGVGATNYNFGEGGIDMSLFWTSQFT